MSKKLLALVLVLAITSMVSAIQWAPTAPGSTAPAGNWNVTSNWDLGRLPVATDATTKLQPNGGDQTANIIVTDAQLAGVKPQVTSFAAKTVLLQVTSTGSISHTGSADFYGGSLALTIDAGGVWNACTNGGSYKMASNTAAGNANSVVTNVYGTLNIKGGAGATLAMVNDSRSGTSGVNVATLNILGNGVVDADAYVIGIYGTATINLSGNGQMKLKNDVRTQVNADIAAGKITGSGIQVSYDAGLNKTIVSVPEPATIALLGLGGLLLRRKK